MTHITLLAYPNCSASGVYAAIDAFSIANIWHKQLRPQPENKTEPFGWDIVSIDGEAVMGSGRATIVPHLSIQAVDTTDIIIIPGSLPPLRFIGKVPNALSRWLRHHHDQGALIGTICTGTFLLAETGLLDHRTATTNLNFATHFQELYPSIDLMPEQILTHDGGFVCAGATTSVLDLCLYLIEVYGDEVLATYCAKALLKDARDSQSPYFIYHYQSHHLDETIKCAQAYMNKNYTQVVSVETLAASLGISPRHFVRRFKAATGDSPLQYLQRIRIEVAKLKLEKTSTSISEITQAVGYEDPNSFRKLFKKTTGLSPKEYRNRFSRRLVPPQQPTENEGQ